MRTSDLILKKRNGGELGEEEIVALVDGYCRDQIPDYQMAAWCMAVYFQGMTAAETAALTLAMANSGETLDLSGIPGVKVDKHSTGGVGDTTTLVLGPLVAAAGAPVAKMSGRALGHTGGTIDKLESIPGLRTSLSQAEFIETVTRIGVAVAGQTADLAPADKRLYALRDVTGTVDSLPLIAGSIMSKKIAAGADAFVLDVKTGRGAFLPEREDALALARTMVSIGEQVGRRTVAIISPMDQPLGRAVGNSLEVAEAVKTLSGRGPADLRELVVTLGAEMLVLAGRAENVDTARERLVDILDSGAGLVKFQEMVAAQDGDPRALEDISLLPRARLIEPVAAPSAGWVQAIDSLEVARMVMDLGACRDGINDPIDLAVGVVLERKVGDRVQAGEPLAVLHANDEAALTRARHQLLAAYTVSETDAPPQPAVVLDRVAGPQPPE